MKLVAIASILGMIQGIKIESDVGRYNNPDLHQGKWWTENKAWKNIPHIKDGMKFLTDGCGFRLWGQPNYRSDGNGRLEW